MSPPLVVIDASVVLALYLPDSPENLIYAAEVRKARADNRIVALVPDFWAAEVAYRLVKSARWKPSPLTATLTEAASFLDHFPQTVHVTPRAVGQIISLAARYNLQGWDALYFDAAVRNRAPLATLDGGLKTACRNFGVTLWQAGEGEVVMA